MWGFCHTYSYLTTSTVLFLLACAGLILGRSQIRFALLSGFLSAPFAFASPAFVPEYWNPKRIACCWAGPEDVIFSFANGVLVWFLAVAPVCDRIRPHFDRIRMLRSFLACTLIGFAVASLFWSAGMSIWGATVVGCAAVSGLVLRRQRELWAVAIKGAFRFAVLYTLLLMGAFAVWPHFLEQWNGATLSGIVMMGVPLEEVVWAGSYGSAWAVMMAHAFGFRSADAVPSSRHRLADALVPMDSGATQSVPGSPAPPRAISTTARRAPCRSAS